MNTNNKHEDIARYDKYGADKNDDGQSKADHQSKSDRDLTRLEQFLQDMKL